jgi:hypothetical protein
MEADLAPRREKTISFPSKELVKLMQIAFERNASFRFSATGFSMFPFIRDGDIITLSPLHGHYYLFGKVAAFYDQGAGNFIVHRVISIRHGSYIFKGDNVNHIDGLIPPENILGIVTKIERGGKNVLFGFGPERILFVFLNKFQLITLFLRCWRLLPCRLRDFVKLIKR